MKKIAVILILSLTIFLIPTTSISAFFRLDYEERLTTYYDGVRYTKMTGSINYDNTITNQIIHYMGGNPTEHSDLNLVVGDNYLPYGFGKGDLHTIIDNVNNRYPNYEVIGGVNGDFYSTNGIPIEAYVRNYEILTMGLGFERTVVGFKDNGEVVFGRPCFTGYEALIYDSDGNIKHTFPIDAINEYPTITGSVTVFFEDYSSIITGDYTKILFGAVETKLDEYSRTYFGKGILQIETTDDVQVTAQKMVLVGDALNSDGIITDQDTVVVQQHMGCYFEGVRFAIGAWEELVKDGIATETYTEGAGPTYRHPRTAIGVKEDGTVFFVVVDGRDYINGYLGVTAYELAEIMLYFDAVDAYNLDGGGSSTMSIKNDDGEYMYLNTPSDGHPRLVSNGLFFVRGEHEAPPETLPYPDNREQLTAPSSFAINSDNILTFNHIANATSYDVELDGQIYTTVNPELQMDLLPGLHFIKVQANGNYTTYRDSEFTPIIVYTVFTDRMKEILDLLKQFTETEIQ